MLIIEVPEIETFDPATNIFGLIKEQKLSLEHSLVSISKWESKWHKPFFGKEKTNEEIIDYIKCMTITQNVKDEVFRNMTSSNLQMITDYLENPMSATWFSESADSKQSKEVITSELIYYLMVAYNIPFECQKWHINRLMTLIKICQIKNEEPKKMSKKEMLSQNAALNQMRRSKLKSKG